MLAQALEVRELSIPFRFSYGHAKATHRGVSSILCIARGEGGLEGYGEAVPRSYVTGETPASVLRAVEQLGPRFLALADGPHLESLRGWMLEEADRWEGPFPSCALCALELALTDLAARQQGSPLDGLLGGRRADLLRYSGSIGIGSKAKVLPQLLLYRALGFKQFKIKVGGSRAIGGLRMARRLLGEGAAFFADANATWSREEAIRNIERLASLGVWAIEEPLLASKPSISPSGQLDREAALDEDHYRDCAWVRARSPIPLIADESLVSPRSLRAIIEHRAFDILNVRLSKVGGLSLASRAVEVARAEGLRFYIGAMVGESPVLATAGSYFASVQADHLAVQGHSHKILHRGSMFGGEPPMRRGGVVTLGSSPGLGLELRRDALDAFTVRQRVLRP